MDLFETNEDRAYWEARDLKKYVIRVEYWPRGCWLIQGRVQGKPKGTYTCYVWGRTPGEAGKRARVQTAAICKWPIGKLYADRWRYFGKQDLDEINRELKYV